MNPFLKSFIALAESLTYRPDSGQPAKTIKKWSDADIAKLKSLLGKMTYSEIAKEMGRTAGSVYGQIQHLGIGTGGRCSNAWTTEEDAYLIMKYGKLSTAEMAIDLCRSCSAVNNRIGRLRKAGKLLSGRG